MLLLGDSGAGKSLYSKLHVLEDLDIFDKNKPLSLHVSMNTLKNPQDSLMEEILDQLSLKEHKTLLQNIKVHLYVDSYDEWFMKDNERRQIDQSL